METNSKYVWDITTEKRFTARQMELVDDIAYTISQGGDVKDMKQKLHQLNLVKKTSSI